MLPITELFASDKYTKLKDKCFLDLITCDITKQKYSGLVIKVPKEYGTGRTDYIEIYTESSKKRPVTDISKMKVGESFDIIFEAERFFPKDFNDYLRNLDSKTKKIGTYEGEGLFSYHNRNIDFVFEISFLKGKYQIISKKGFFAKLLQHTLIRIK